MKFIFSGRKVAALLPSGEQPDGLLEVDAVEVNREKLSRQLEKFPRAVKNFLPGFNKFLIDSSKGTTQGLWVFGLV